jgi:hypothetical protein
LAVGPVRHADDAVANKVCALFGRAEVRDYVDVDAILASGRYTSAYSNMRDITTHLVAGEP